MIAGSIKIWDFGSGQCIKEKHGRISEEDLSITGLMYSKLEDDRVLIASGWNNKLKILLVGNRLHVFQTGGRQGAYKSCIVMFETACFTQVSLYTTECIYMYVIGRGCC